MRRSIDAHGLTRKGPVRYGYKVENASWGRSRLSFGDGDAVWLNRLTLWLGMIGHELTNGVVAKADRRIPRSNTILEPGWNLWPLTLVESICCALQTKWHSDWIGR